MAAIIDGKKVAEEVLAECSREIEDLKVPWNYSGSGRCFGGRRSGQRGLR